MKKNQKDIYNLNARLSIADGEKLKQIEKKVNNYSTSVDVKMKDIVSALIKIGYELPPEKICEKLFQ